MSNELLQRYVEGQCEQAFADLVRQHIDLVYSAALRQVNGDTAAAQDVVQAVFTDLARKAPRLKQHTSLTGWLYTSTRFLAAKVRRSEQRRRAREEQAHTMNQLLHETNSDPSWDDLSPVLDEVMHDLNTADREAVLMRYFERRPLAEIGVRLGLTENAARMRVERALDKLRDALTRRGVASTLVALGVLLSQKTVNAAPIGLAGQVTRTSLAVGAGTGLAVLFWKLPIVASLKWVAAVAIVLGVASWLAWPHGPGEAGGTVRSAAAPVPTLDVVSTAGPAEKASSSSDSKVSPAVGVVSTDKLILKIVAADNVKPVPTVSLDYWVWLAGKVNHKRPLVASRFGICEVPVPRDQITRLILVSEVDGFAETRLEWNTERGAVIPADTRCGWSGPCRLEGG